MVHPIQSLFDKAMAAQRRGDLAEAETLYGRVLKQAPGLPEAQMMLAMVHLQAGRIGKALPLATQAAATRPAPPLLANLATVQRQAGRWPDAERTCRKLVELTPGAADAWSDLADTQTAQGKSGEALDARRRAAELDPTGARLAALGRALEQAGHWGQAVAVFAHAVLRAPDNPSIRRHFVTQLRGASFSGPVPAVVEALELIFATPEATVLHLEKPALQLLRHEVGLATLLADPPLAWPDARWNAVRDCRLLRLVLRRGLLADSGFERLLATLRRQLVLAGPAAIGSDNLLLLADLALQLHNNEFVWPAEDDELAAARALPPTAAAPLLLAALYQPIDRLVTSPPPDLPDGAAPLVQRYLLDVQGERAHRSGVQSLTTVTDEVSVTVQEQYEENPYPRWFDFPEVEQQSLEREVVGSLGQIVSLPALGTPGEALIAGCGSGWQALRMAMAHPDWRVLAIDLSRANLGLAALRAEQAGVGNLMLRQGDILALPDQCGRSFPYVECVGVLHHMQDPLAGWQALTALTAPGGVQRIAVYSSLGRGIVHAGRALASAMGLGDGPADIRTLRCELLSGQHAALKPLIEVREFYAMSSCRDLLFHRQENHLTIDWIRAGLDALDLEFLGFQIRRPATLAAYRSRFTDDPQMLNLENWARFEADFPTTFSNMYDFFCRRR